jgi:DNA repair protein RAD50
MSSIHKLGIIGIRSYSPENEEVVKFFRPLTLILGKNGAGKTVTLFFPK